MYWIIYQTETDGEIMMWPCQTPEEVSEYATRWGLHITDYAVIKGEKLKDFDYQPLKK